jgi:16S rRNA (cytidine1402-2'-O)-methyltransferase
MIFYEAPHKLKYTLEDMYKFWGDRQVVLAREMTKIHEEVIRDDLKNVIEKFKECQPKGEFVIIVKGNKEVQEENCFWSEMSEKEHVEYYINQGMGKIDAIKKVALDRNIPKREVYEIYCIKNSSKK